MIIVFLGPPGSGKGTQAQMLDDEHGFFHFDTGSLLRTEIATGSDLGQRIGSYTNQGLLVPIEIIRELLLKFFRTTDAKRIMLDGFPRNLEQAQVLAEGLTELGDDLDHAIYLHVEQEALLERIVNRRFCPTCGAIYNIKTEPPTNPGVCDHDGTVLTQRKDDTEEVFANRLRVYFEQTAPLLDYYRQRGLLREIDGARTPEEIAGQILALLGVGHGGSEA
jgi:adenylate kinase